MIDAAIPKSSDDAMATVTFGSIREAETPRRRAAANIAKNASGGSTMYRQARRICAAWSMERIGVGR
jgi:hypothetical protein